MGFSVEVASLPPNTTFQWTLLETGNINLYDAPLTTEFRVVGHCGTFKEVVRSEAWIWNGTGEGRVQARR